MIKVDQKKAGGFFVRFDCGSDPRSSVLAEVYPQMSRTAKASRPQNRDRKAAKLLRILNSVGS